MISGVSSYGCYIITHVSLTWLINYPAPRRVSRNRWNPPAYTPVHDLVSWYMSSSPLDSIVMPLAWHCCSAVHAARPDHEPPEVRVGWLQCDSSWKQQLSAYDWCIRQLQCPPMSVSTGHSWSPLTTLLSYQRNMQLMPILYGSCRLAWPTCPTMSCIRLVIMYVNPLIPNWKLVSISSCLNQIFSP